MFDPVFSDPPLLLSPIHLFLEQNLHMLNLVCIARVFFFYLGECMWLAQGQSALSRQRVRGWAASLLLLLLYSIYKAPIVCSALYITKGDTEHL
ncbi:unnamed protein product [Staurois parvus]|uniref:Uncharacterized protein n=1 Tax=Staurois parvus TaxID=386267 RepID=A0ABN9G427_9NEOB|nr:unnamed protein product [Staurois parvus]